MAHDHHRFNPEHAERLNNPRRLERQVSEADLVRLLALRGDEDVADLGSGTGLYTDIVARHTTGIVHAVELSQQMMETYRQKGVPANVRLVEADIRALPLPAGGIDVAYSIVTLHETAGDLGMSRLLEALRAPGRVVVIDWRRDPASWEEGPGAEIRLNSADAVRLFEPFFETVTVDDLGPFMFVLVATGKRETAAAE